MAGSVLDNAVEKLNEAVDAVNAAVASQGMADAAGAAAHAATGGAIDPFISAALAQRVTGEAVEVEDVE